MEGLQRLEGVKTVEERVDPVALTASLITEKERLPSPASIEKALKRTGEQFSLRGVEIVAEGLLARSGEQWQLLLPGEKPLPLASLTAKVQWDVKKKERSTASEKETASLRRLIAEAASRRQRVRITGPLRQSDNGDLTLEVRDFAWVTAQRVARGRK